MKLIRTIAMAAIAAFALVAPAPAAVHASIAPAKTTIKAVHKKVAVDQEASTDLSTSTATALGAVAVGTHDIPNTCSIGLADEAQHGAEIAPSDAGTIKVAAVRTDR